MKKLVIACSALLILAIISLFVGVLNISPAKLLAGNAEAWSIFWTTRVPRTVALVLAGMAMAIAGTIMQLLARNRFVEPSTAGTVESASLGLLVAMILAPSMPLYGKMLCAAFAALIGTTLFMLILQRVPLRSTLVVPLTGIMLGSVISAITNFFAYRYDLLQSVLIWTSGDFSSVMSGRYELLWIVAPLTLCAYIAANRFTAAGLGENFTANIGLNYRGVMVLGLIIISAITALIVATVGQIPFLGLIVPNIVALKMGDNMRRNLPYTALLGAGLVLICDIAGRLIRYPYEIPVSTMMGVLGSVLFIYILLKGKKRFSRRKNLV